MSVPLCGWRGNISSLYVLDPSFFANANKKELRFLRGSESFELVWIIEATVVSACFSIRRKEKAGLSFFYKIRLRIV